MWSFCQKRSPEKVTGLAVRERCCITSLMPARGMNIFRTSRQRTHFRRHSVPQSVRSVCPGAVPGSITRQTGARSMLRIKNTGGITRLPSGSATSFPKSSRSPSFLPVAFTARMSPGLFPRNILRLFPWTRSSCRPDTLRMTLRTLGRRERHWQGTDTFPTSSPTNNGSRPFRDTLLPSTLPMRCWGSCLMLWKRDPMLTTPSWPYGPIMDGTSGKKNTGRSLPHGEPAPEFP